MALKVKSEKVKKNGKIWVFLFFFVMLLIIFALFLVLLLLIGGINIYANYIYFYTEFIPLTIVLPLIIALTTSLSYKTSLMRITPANNVNINMLKDFFINKANYRLIEEKDGFIKFERSKAFHRLLWLNIDKPTIEVKENEVLVTLEKHTEAILTPIIVYGKRYELNPDN